ncbi:hypothetical protein FPSE5266_07795 [Fusarium pseudograminearum]|nr:hypothetical protein FPSE5266_07795 [Fusarium pseudograminearum]
MKPAVQKVINYGLGNLRLIFKYATEIGSVPVTGLESPFDDTFAKSIMKITSENENFPKKNSTVIIYTTPAAQGYVQMAALSSVMGYDKLIGANVAYFPGTKFFSEFPISIGKNIWNSFGFDRFTNMHKATGLPSGTILKNGGKTVIMDGKLKESVAEFCNSSNGKFGSVNQQSITGIGKLEKGKDLYIFAHSLGTALSMPFLYQSLASGNFGRIIVVTAGGYCSTNDVAAKQLQDMGLEIYNLQTLGDPITEWSHFESPGFAVLQVHLLFFPYVSLTQEATGNVWFGNRRGWVQKSSVDSAVKREGYADKINNVRQIYCTDVPQGDYKINVHYYKDISGKAPPIPWAVAWLVL